MIFWRGNMQIEAENREKKVNYCQIRQKYYDTG